MSDQTTQRQTCTKEHPRPKDAKGQWQHDRTETIDEEYNGLSGGGDYETLRCLNCGLEFRVQLPD